MLRERGNRIVTNKTPARPLGRGDYGRATTANGSDNRGANVRSAKFDIMERPDGSPPDHTLAGAARPGQRTDIEVTAEFSIRRRLTRRLPISA